MGRHANAPMFDKDPSFELSLCVTRMARPVHIKITVMKYVGKSVPLRTFFCFFPGSGHVGL